MDADLRDKLIEAQNEKGFSVEGFSRRDFAIMCIITQTVLSDDDLLSEVNPLEKFKGLDVELQALNDKLTDFLGI